MNGNDKIQETLIDHEVRITRLEEAVKHILQTLGRIENDLSAFRSEMRSEQKSLREALERQSEVFARQMDALRQEFHRDRRFNAMVFLTTQLAVVGALLRLAGVF